MRFKKGSKVEVLSKQKTSLDSWLCGEIISGNGHTYSVRYGWFPVTSDAVLERVPRKAIRPCPPPTEGADNWAPDNLAEVFHDLSWKTATILKVLGLNIFLVRVLGTFQEIKVHRTYLRVQQCWQDGKWFGVGKGGPNRTVLTRKKTGMKSKQVVREDSFQALSMNSHVGVTHFEQYPVAVQKTRAIEVDRIPQQKCPRHSSQLCEKVDACIFPQQNIGKNYLHTSFNIGISEISEMDVDRGKVNGRRGSFSSGTSTHLDTESSASSVGSCSFNCKGDRSPSCTPHIRR